MFMEEVFMMIVIVIGFFGQNVILMYDFMVVVNGFVCMMIIEFGLVEMIIIGLGLGQCDEGGNCVFFVSD